MEITGKTILVTGGASGLGEGVARLFVAKGARVAIIDINQERGEKLSAELGEKAMFLLADITKEDDVNKMLGAIVEKFSAVHFAVNCAGTGIAQRTVSKNGPHPLDSFEWIIKLNLVGTFNVASKAAFFMSKNEPNADGERGVIVNVASIAAFEGQIGQAAYAASKAGVVGMTLPMARDLAGVGIRVVTVAPGLFATPMTDGFPEETRRMLTESIVFPKRFGKNEDFARLVSEIVENPYLNGETIRLDAAVRMGPR